MHKKTSTLYVSLLALCAILSNTANAAVFQSESTTSVKKTAYKISNNAEDFRRQRKVGIGWGAAGNLGLFGLQLELNFIPELSVITGYGISRGFQSATFQFKKAFTGGTFLPYLSGGYSRWYSTGKNESLNETSPQFFSEKFLNNKEREKGEFAENLLFATAGLQYLQFNGDWAGASFYAEVLFLVDIDDFVAAPTGGVGMFYYF